MIVFNNKPVIDIEIKGDQGFVLGIHAQPFPAVPPCTAKSAWWVAEFSILAGQPIAILGHLGLAVIFSLGDKLARWTVCRLTCNTHQLAIYINSLLSTYTCTIFIHPYIRRGKITAITINTRCIKVVVPRTNRLPQDMFISTIIIIQSIETHVLIITNIFYSAKNIKCCWKSLLLS
jgi:hypothetical protein